MKKLFSTRYSDGAFNFAILLLRLGFGGLMMVNHGYMKLANYAQMSQKFGDPLHIGTSTSLALTIFAEFFCAAFLILGLFTRLACIPLIIDMSVAFFMVHKHNYGPPNTGGGEMALLFLTAYLTLLFTGPGRISLDRFIGK